MSELVAAIIALLESIQRDEHRSGGLLSRETLRLAGLLAKATTDVQASPL